jgi:hypothetical protein
MPDWKIHNLNHLEFTIAGVHAFFEIQIARSPAAFVP